MSKIHGMMDVGRRSMMNSQTALSTTAHNISGQKVAGYSRQRVETLTNPPIGEGTLRIGMGARAAAVERINNPYLERQLAKEKSQLGYAEGRTEAMARLEEVYNEQSSKGLNQYMADFYNSLQEMANTPDSLAARTQVRETAKALTGDFRRVHRALTEIQGDIDSQVKARVLEINTMTEEVAKLNEKIRVVELAGSHANDERDRRDQLVKEIGEKVNIRWAEGEDGTVTITAGKSGLLVAGYTANSLEVQQTPGRDGKREGLLDVFIKQESGELHNITEQLIGGRIGGLLEVRDKTIGESMASTDELAEAFVDEFNEIHQSGVDAYGLPGGDFFIFREEGGELSSRIDIAESIKKDPFNIVTGKTAGAPGDNRVAKELAQLKFRGLMEGGATFDGFYNSLVSRVGLQTKQAQVASENQSGIVKQLSNLRESISGVSMDEETAKLIEFQKAFDASARLIKTADEMFDTVLALKRL